MKHAFLFLAPIFSLSACISTPELDKIPAPSPIIKAETILSNEIANPTVLDALTVQIPTSLLTIREIARPRVEVREGPSSDFSITDALLTEGEEVICFSRVGVWQKVFVPRLSRHGWVHYQTLGEPKKDDRLVEVKISQLPRVFATRTVSQGFAAGSLAKVQVKFPRGASFAALTETESKVLVILDETQSVIWLKKKDAQ